MTNVTCRLTAKNRDQLRNPTLGNRVWATFTFLPLFTLECDVVYQCLGVRQTAGGACEVTRGTAYVRRMYERPFIAL